MHTQNQGRPRMRPSADETAVGAAAPAGPGRGHLAPVVLVAVAVALVLPVADLRLAAQPSFVPVMLAVVCCFDVLSVVLLMAQFRDTGEARTLALSWAYAFSLVVLLGWAAAFPSVLGTPGPLGAVPSTAPWLWVVWHTAFPVLLAVALAPWPGRADAPVPPARRRTLALGTVAASVLAGAVVVAGVVAFADSLPRVISGIPERGGAVNPFFPSVVRPFAGVFGQRRLEGRGQHGAPGARSARTNGVDAVPGRRTMRCRRRWLCGCGVRLHK